MSNTTIMSATAMVQIAAAFTLILSMSVKSQSVGEAEFIYTIKNGTRKCVELNDPRGWDVAAWKPGYYCISQNLHQSRPLIEFAHQAVPLSPLIGIYSNNVTIDLQGHHLKSTTQVDYGVFTNFSGDEKNLPTIIKNGEITTPKIPTIRMVDAWNIDNMRFGKGLGLASPHGDMSKYKPTVFVLENLTLRSEQHVIIMQGKRNIIRNCTIVGGNGTVNVYGPNLLFEGNTVILNAQTPKTSDDEKPVALYLEDAADSVVRNNKIVIKGSGVLNPSAIVLVNSPNVLLEHNIIRGTKEVYKLLDEHSSVKATANDAK